MKAVKFTSSVDDKGKIKIPKLPFSKGAKVEIIIIQEDDFSDLLKASEISLSFWDNPLDDEVWNEA